MDIEINYKSLYKSGPISNFQKYTCIIPQVRSEHEIAVWVTKDASIY